MTHPRPRWLVVALLGLTGALLTAAPAAGGTPLADGAEPRLVVVGAPGLAWSDVDGAELPALDRLADEGSVGSLTVRALRSRSCAVDGWLTLSSGRRAADRAGPCRDPAAVGADGVVPDWAGYLRSAEEASYGARPGTLGDRARNAGACVETVGSGAAVAGATSDGAVTHHHEALPSSFSCPVVLLDTGVLPADGADRGSALERLDATVAAVRAVDPGADVVVAGVGDGASPVRPRLLVATGPGFGPGVLTSTSTSQPGVAQLQDVTATVLTRLGAPTDGLTGRPLSAVGSEQGGATRVADRAAFETRAAVMRAVSPQVTGWVAAGYAAWAVAVAVLWWRRRGRGHALPGPLVTAGVAVAATPVSTFAANLLPWWRLPAPAVVFLVALSVVVAGLTALALWAERRAGLGALRLVAVVTLVVLAADVLTGSRLQLGSVFGQNPVVGARFYGFGNTSFALYGLAVLVVVGWVAGSATRSRRLSAGFALVLLVAALALEALPSLGADFGGPPGLLLGGLVVVATASGLRLTPGRVVAAVLAAAAVGLLVAWVDWLRPPAARTHLGEFVESVLSGEAGSVVGRKLAQNVANLGSPPLLAVTLATVALAVVAWRSGWRPVAGGDVVLRGALVLAAVGFAVNDSGLVIPAFVALVLAPLLVAAGPSHRNLHHGRGTEGVPR